MSIQIQTSPALIGINRTPPRQEVHQDSNVLDISSTQAKVEINNTFAHVQIDQSQCFNEAGLKGIGAFLDELVSLGKQSAMSFTGKVVDQGNQLANVQNGGNPYKNQAKYNAFDQFEHQFGVKSIPTSRPSISIIEGNAEIRAIDGEVSNDTQIKKPQLNYERSKIEAYVKQMNSLQINYIDEKA